MILTFWKIMKTYYYGWMVGYILLTVLLTPSASYAQKTGIPAQKISNSLKMEFMYISPGTFMMGSPANEVQREDPEKQHKVTLTKGFYIQSTETTVGQWRAFVQETGFKTNAEKIGYSWTWTGIEWKETKKRYWDKPGFPQTDEHPVTCVSWNDVHEFIKWLNRKEGKTYRLPTEAEWEYACRAGTETPFSIGKCLGDNANYDGKYPYADCPKGRYAKGTVPVASFAPNPWGLYDVHGNVWEWCEDVYDEEAYKDNVTDPLNIGKYKEKVFRSGSWVSYERYCRSANRNWEVPDTGYFDLGFRIVMTP